MNTITKEAVAGVDTPDVPEFLKRKGGEKPAVTHVQDAEVLSDASAPKAV